MQARAFNAAAKADDARRGASGRWNAALRRKDEARVEVNCSAGAALAAYRRCRDQPDRGRALEAACDYASARIDGRSGSVRGNTARRRWRCWAARTGARRAMRRADRSSGRGRCRIGRLPLSMRWSTTCFLSSSRFRIATRGFCDEFVAICAVYVGAARALRLRDGGAARSGRRLRTRWPRHSALSTIPRSDRYACASAEGRLAARTTRGWRSWLRCKRRWKNPYVNITKERWGRFGRQLFFAMLIYSSKWAASEFCSDSYNGRGMRACLTPYRRRLRRCRWKRVLKTAYTVRPEVERCGCWFRGNLKRFFPD